MVCDVGKWLDASLFHFPTCKMGARILTIQLSVKIKPEGAAALRLYFLGHSERVCCGGLEFLKE